MSEVSLEGWLAIIAIIVEGPIVWWLAKRKDDKDETNSKYQALHARITRVQKEGKEYTDQQVEHAAEKNALMFQSILEELRYIRGRVDDQASAGKQE